MAGILYCLLVLVSLQFRYVHGRIVDNCGFRYAFPPLLKSVIAEDLGLSDSQVLTSNVIALLATLLVRLVAGTACDRFGARWTFAGCLLIGALPTFLAGTANTFSELCALRFFVGILGGSFVPCQVWTTACEYNAPCWSRMAASTKL